MNAVFHYLPLHASSFGTTHGRTVGELGVTVRASASLLRLPLWAGMTDVEVERVIDVVRTAVPQVGERMHT